MTLTHVSHVLGNEVCASVGASSNNPPNTNDLAVFTGNPSLVNESIQLTFTISVVLKR